MLGDTSASRGAVSKAHGLPRPPFVALGEVTPNNIKQARVINSVLFPVNYEVSFYQGILEAGELARLAYFNDVCVGTVFCRREPSKDGKAEKIYILTLGVLAPYRRLGLGTTMLNHVLAQASTKTTHVYLHVQHDNAEALAFYEKNGFERKELVPDYYKGIEPAAAYLLEKRL